MNEAGKPGTLDDDRSFAHATNTTPPMKDLAGKVAFITGGDSGIGLGIALASLNAGMNVVIAYRTAAHLQEAMNVLHRSPGQIHAIKLDVTDRTAMAEAAKETVRVFGKVHVLVNNAGVAPMGPLSKATFDDWDWCMNVNVTGVFNGIRAFLPYIQAHNEGGHIVATSSMLGGLLAGQLWGVYSASKFAVVGMMEALRAELAATNVGVSLFCPAGVKSNLGASDRNRPAIYRDHGTLDHAAQASLDSFGNEIERIVRNQSDAIMDPAEAGERVIQGIRNNDLYILSHPEYEPLLQERSDALLASIARPEASRLPEGRTAIARLARNSIYSHEAAARRQRQNG